VVVLLDRLPRDVDAKEIRGDRTVVEPNPKISTRGKPTMEEVGL